MTAPVMMGVASPTGSHLPSLIAACDRLQPGALVMEHGAGMYSTPLLCRYDVRVLCAESHAGWLDWARWMYGDRAEFVDSYKRLVPRLTETALIFIDGEAKERGPLLLSALERNVPEIICHDTHERDWQHYAFQPHHFTWRGYRIEHFAEDTHRTTVWRRSS